MHAHPDLRASPGKTVIGGSRPCCHFAASKLRPGHAARQSLLLPVSGATIAGNDLQIGGCSVVKVSHPLARSVEIRPACAEPGQWIQREAPPPNLQLHAWTGRAYGFKAELYSTLALRRADYALGFAMLSV